MTKQRVLVLMLLVFGGVTLLYLVLSVVWAGIRFTANFQEDDLQLVSKGKLTPGVSSGRQTITDPYEGHLYEFSGKANQSIEIRIRPFSDVYMMGLVFSEGYSSELARAFGDLEGGLGDDLIIEVRSSYRTLNRSSGQRR